MKVTAILTFLGVVLLILGAIHAYLYISFVTFFGITAPATRKILAVAFAFLAVSFVLSSIGVRVFHGEGFRILYGLSALWFGAALLLVITSTVLWPLAAAVRWGPLAGHPGLVRNSALLLYGLTALFIIYNVAAAHRVEVTRLAVSLTNLPEAWRGRTVAHLSDLHLGAYWSRRFLEEVVEKTMELKPDMIVITGDLFDGASGGHERYLEGLKGLDAPRGVYFISGNHEVYSGLDKTIPAVRKAGITVLDDTLVNLGGLQLIGIASPTMEPSSRPVFDFTALPDYHRDLPAILLYHTPTDIDGTSLEPGGSDSPYLSPRVGFRTVIDAGVSLQLSGHTHAGQFIPFTWLTKRIFAGYHYGLNRIGDFQIYIHSGTGTWAAPFRSGSSSEIALITLEKAPD